VIVGHTDAVETSEYNQTPSQRRAVAVLTLSMAQGAARHGNTRSVRGEHIPSETRRIL